MNIEQFLDLVSDPKKYKAYLDEITAKQSALEDVISTYGKVTEIGDLRAKAKQAADKADSIVDTAKQEAASIIEKAKQSLSQEWDAFNTTVAQQTKKIQEADSKFIQASDLKKQAEQLIKEAEKREREASTLISQYTPLLQEVQEKAAKLRAVLGN